MKISDLSIIFTSKLGKTPNIIKPFHFSIVTKKHDYHTFTCL